MSGLTHNVSAQADELLDHIYEYGTNSEGVILRINQLCDAAVEQLRAELAAIREREARMRKLVGFLLIVARTAGDAMPETHARIVSEAEAALADGAQG